MNPLNENELVSELRARGISPSPQRIAVYGFLKSHPIHPTADTIMKELKPILPTLSLTTVYNTLKLFAEHGIVQVLTIESGELRYDIRTDFHAHFKCRKCGKVTDLMLPMPDLAPSPDFQVEHTVLDFYGTCPECRK